MNVGDTSEWLVFFNVLLQQLGVPVPSVPTMIVAASLVHSGIDLFVLAGLAVLASLLADWVWYLAGRGFGYRVLSVLCKLSINPESCVTSTEFKFKRWGAWSLVLAKFIPGFSTVAPPIAGAVRMPLWQFTLASALGAALWAGAALLAGWLFSTQVSTVFEVLHSNALAMALVVGLGLAVLVLWKWSRRLAYMARHQAPKTRVEELDQHDEALHGPLRLLDLRPDHIQTSEPLAGWTPARLDSLQELSIAWGAGDRIVTLCACPNDVTACEAAAALEALGFVNARALLGGYEALQAHQQRKLV